MEGLILLILLIALYFLPIIVAASRHHRNTTGVFLLNLLLGWTLIGWIGALIWAVLEQERGQAPHKYQHLDRYKALLESRKRAAPAKNKPAKKSKKK